MLRVTFTMNLYLCHLMCLTMSLLLYSKDIRHSLLSKWRQLMAMLMAIPIFLPTHLIMWREWSVILVLNEPDHMKSWSSSHVALLVMHLIFCFCKDLKLMGSDKICTASCTYIHILSLCHLYPLPVSYLKNRNENFQKTLFSCNFSHNFTPKKNELRYHCCLSQLYFIGH